MKTMQPITENRLKEILFEAVPELVRKGTDDLRSEITRHSDILKNIQFDIRHLNNLAREQGILYEDLNDRFMADTELLRGNYDVKQQVDDHGQRLNELEIRQKLMKQVLHKHSMKLNSKII